MMSLAKCATTQEAYFIAIDETLANSKLQWVVWGSIIMVLLVLFFGLNLPLSYQIGLTLLTGICVFLSQIYPYHVIAISTLPLTYTAKTEGLGEVEWQIGMTQLEFANFFTPNHQQAQLWQALLIKTSYYRIAVILEFESFSPLEKTLRLIIWQDQVTPDTWRKLCVLAKL